MTHFEEYTLYIENRNAWAAYIAPRWAEMLSYSTPATKRELWTLAGAELRSALNRLSKRVKS